MTARSSEGFTLVEVSVVAALLVPLLLVLGSAGQAVVGSFEVNTRAAEMTEVLVRTTKELEFALRPGYVSTLSVQATRADVRAGLASAIGEWIPMQELDARDGIRLESASGEDCPAMAVRRVTKQLTFVRDSRELANGADDDNDGLIDEGELRLRQNGETFPLLRGVELCSFEREGDLLRIALRVARRIERGRVRRVSINESMLVRNP